MNGAIGQERTVPGREARGCGEGFNFNCEGEPAHSCTFRQIMVDLNMHPTNQPQFMVSRAQEKFDANMKLTDQQVLET